MGIAASATGPRFPAFKPVAWSAALHLLLFLLMLVCGNYMRRAAISQVADLEVELVPVPAENQAEKDKKRRMIVESERAPDARTPDKDAYLGERDQVVARQTRAARVGRFTEAAPGRQGTENVDQSEKKPTALSDLGLSHDMKPLGHLSPQAREQLGQSAASSDYLQDTKIGAQTMLNTREYAYFSYYQRVRRQLEQYWEPGLRQRLRKMVERGRTLASEKEHSTKLLVVMGQSGNIEKILVQDTSGVLDLDQAAIDAFNKAGPFPNPPRGLVERDGTVKVEWQFVLRT